MVDNSLITRITFKERVVEELLIGTYEHNMDAKNRVIMPAKFREVIGDKFCLTLGFDGCIRAYSETEWNKYKERFEGLPESNQNARRIQRLIFANSCDCEVDKQGRVIIPPNLLKHAELDKNVVIIGQSTYIEIWAKERWTTYQPEEETLSLEELIGSLSEYGL